MLENGPLRILWRSAPVRRRRNGGESHGLRGIRRAGACRNWCGLGQAALRFPWSAECPTPQHVAATNRFGPFHDTLACLAAAAWDKPRSAEELPPAKIEFSKNAQACIM